MARRAAIYGVALFVVASVSAAPVAYGPARVGVLPNNQRALQTPEGLTLYVYDRDPAGEEVSNCTSACVNSWPPFTPETTKGARRKSGGDWTVIARDEGSKQWAYRGKPLYRFYRDTRPGQSNGAFFEGGAWSIAHP